MWVSLVLVTWLSAGVAQNLRPVIGIMTQPISSDLSYLAASYVKYIEGAGAQVVPVRYDAPTANLSAIFAGLNGLLFPGGGASLALNSSYFQASQFMWNLAMNANRKGDHFPIWGTCLGFQLISVLVGNESVLTSGFDSENYPIALTFTANATQSRLFDTSTCPSYVYNALGTKPITMNNHQDGVTPAAFVFSSAMTSFYRMMSTNVDRKGREFVSTIEGLNMPVYGTQWHPEKNLYEWNYDEQIPHSLEAVLSAQYVADFFVNEARQNTHQFSQEVLDELLIYNFNAVFTGSLKRKSDFEQTYYWRT